MPTEPTRGILRIGCAGWTLPRDAQEHFAEGDSHLQRYSTRLNAVEINSSFYRSHTPATYARWAASTADGFRFSVKLPKTITHEHRMLDCEPLLDAFFMDIQGLGSKLACLLLQLPPSFAFEAELARQFLTSLGKHWQGDLSMEPRHATWFEPEANSLLEEFRVARVLADPVRHPRGEFPGGASHLVYLRLHGTPRVYYSSYGDEVIDRLARRIDLALADGTDVWCIFDNTASGAATHNALSLRSHLLKDLE